MEDSNRNHYGFTPNCKSITFIVSAGHIISVRRGGPYSAECHLQVLPRGVAPQVLVSLGPKRPVLIVREHDGVRMVTFTVPHRARAAGIRVIIPSTVFYRFVLRQTSKDSACVCG